MSVLIEFETPRLIVRQWCYADFAPFAALNADPQVMEYFPAILSRAESDAAAERIQKVIADYGWGFWAIEEKSSGRFIGFTGLNIPSPELPCSPCTEIGWRLAREFWGKGYASEAARGALAVGFERLHLPEIVSFTSVHNLKSQAVMQRLGMVQDEFNFQHPKVAEGHYLREHCLFRLSASLGGVC